MATPTYDLISSQVLSTSASSVTFSSISQDYRDLVLVCEASHTKTGYNNMRLILNSDTGSNYNLVSMGGDGSSAFSTSASNQAFMDITGTNLNTSQVGLFTCQFMDYSATDKHKTVLTKHDSAERGTNRFANRWASTSAITSIQVSFETDQIASGSTFYLYGIAS